MQDFSSSSSTHIAFDGSSDCEARALYVSLESRVMLCKQLLGLGHFFGKELFDVGAERTEWKQV